MPRGLRSSRLLSCVLRLPSAAATAVQPTDDSQAADPICRPISPESGANRATEPRGRIKSAISARCSGSSLPDPQIW